MADKREMAYERSGIGSSYLFRIDDDFVVDATKKGSMRLVQLGVVGHSCTDELTTSQSSDQSFLQSQLHCQNNYYQRSQEDCHLCQAKSVVFFYQSLQV